MDDLSHLNKTPAFIVDRDIVARNCERMRAKAEASGVIFRPHVKTHKTVEIARMQHGGSTGPVTVSTLAEAELLSRAGFGDITYAVPIAPDRAGVAGNVTGINLLVDSVEALQAVEALDRQTDVFLKIDCGYHRAGVDPDDPKSLDLARRMASSEKIRFRGLLTHAGHSYHAKNADEVLAVARQETDAVTRFRDRLGIDVIRSIGSTPTTSVVERFENCDEVRPGNYVFFDAFQAAIGSCRMADVAASVLTTVIGSYPERRALIVDAGALALSKDLGPNHIHPEFGYGVVCDLNLRRLPMRLHALSQEHGTIETDMTLPVGTRLRIVPNHSCLTAAMYPSYVVVEKGRFVDEWIPARGW
jgi:D-serine deaminase-like pyridoxal phosphate-dependent protein